MDEITKIKSILTNQADQTGLPVFLESELTEFRNNYSMNSARTALAEYIVENNIPFPIQEILYSDVVEKFLKLQATPLYNFLSTNTDIIIDKFNDYKYSVQDYCTDVVELGHYYNDISNYFHQETRLRCNGYDILSPLNTWENIEALKKFNWTFWREGIVQFIDQGKYREAFRLGAYTATQFKPHVAKFIYDRFGAKTVLDSSCGWGDRLAGFYASGAEIYVGCDPNPDVYSKYMDQCIFYEGLLGNADPKIYQGEGYYSVKGEKEVIVFCEGSEKMGDQWPHLNYDLAFTSPPYFGTERYAEGVAEEEQSWHAYPTYESWINDYLFKTLDNINNVLSETGAIAINIIDVKMQNKRYLVCDPMTKYMKSIGMPLQEVIGMRMKQRPKNVTGGDVEYMQECFIEPIWVYSANKENIETPFQRLFT